MKFILEGTRLCVDTSSRTYLGDLVQDVDGFYKWFPTNLSGYIDQGSLLALHNFMATLNKPWQARIEALHNATPK